MAKKGTAYQSPTKRVLIPADIGSLGAAGGKIAAAIRTNWAKLKADTEKNSGGKKTI
jgi:hypothetical protein